MSEFEKRSAAVCAKTLAAAAVLVAVWVASASGAVNLPDNRAYELVSPPEKVGGDIVADSSRTRFALKEIPGLPMAASFVSLTGFGDVVGTGISTEYLSARHGEAGTPGWGTHAITPPQDPLTFLADTRSFEGHYQGSFSDDLTVGAFRAWSPLTTDPFTANVTSLYKRADLRSPGSGAYELVSACPACGVPLANPATAPSLLPRFVGASRDFEHIVFESRFKLTADAPAGTTNPKLYLWAHGVVRLVGVQPNSATSFVRSIGGQGIGSGGAPTFPRNVVSSDGARINFTVASGATGATGALYQRNDQGTADGGDDTTVQLNASERTDCAGDPTCGGDGTPDPVPDSAAPATYWDASEDGTRVFFTTQQALTDDAELGPVSKLYMYDASRSPTDPSNLTLLSVDNERSDTTAGVLGVLGVGGEGSYVYFLQRGQLVAGAPTLDTSIGIYLWHEGDIAYVGKMADEGDPSGNLNHNWSLNPGLNARVTPDGTHLLFASHSPEGLGDYNHGSCSNSSISGGCQQFYLYDAISGDAPVCVSCKPDGAPAASDAEIDIRSGAAAAATSFHLTRALTDDGDRVFFTTGDSLVATDSNGGVRDVYEYDAGTGAVHLLSSGKDMSHSYFMGADANGDNAFILTRGRLVGWDVDENYDLYDVRVAGGFPNPPANSPQCSGDACQGAASSAPASPLIGSSILRHALPRQRALSGPKRLRCSRNRVRKRIDGRVRCVKKGDRRKVGRLSNWRVLTGVDR